MSITIPFSYFHVYVSNRSEADITPLSHPDSLIMPLVITGGRLSTRTCVPGILTSVASALPLLLLILGATLGPQIPMCNPPSAGIDFQNGLHSSHLWWTPKQLTSVIQGFTCLHFLFCFRNAGTVQVLL